MGATSKFKRRKTVATARPVAIVIADAERRVGREIPARSRPLAIDRAAHAAANLAFEGDAARRRIVGTDHAHQRRGQGNRHVFRDAAFPRGSQVLAVEIDTKGGATGATTQARMFRHDLTSTVKKRADCRAAPRLPQTPLWRRAFPAFRRFNVRPETVSASASLPRGPSAPASIEEAAREPPTHSATRRDRT